MCMGILAILYLLNSDLTELESRLPKFQADAVLYCCNTKSGTAECSM
ncbi:ORF06 [Psittacine aviadenovirus B]|uniref:ORF06 n=1 Tax=psittacine adenovirus 4 TaxID=2773287 RepID=A0A1P8SW57_9ADEN|nr:ORF06 [Psittacine aviadenovirus B]APY28338.1 ORF06 [psittacine adenovirus 4]